MKDYYQQSIKALQLAGLSERTQQCYTRSVRQLVDFYPEAIRSFIRSHQRQCYKAMFEASSQTLKYLAPYVFRVAISNSRIIKVEDRRVFFKYKKQRSNRWRTMSLEVMAFIHRFLQHVLPSGFMKVRYYGFMSPGSAISIKLVADSIEQCAAAVVYAVRSIRIEPFVPKCEKCGGSLVYYASIVPIHLPATGAG